MSRVDKIMTFSKNVSFKLKADPVNDRNDSQSNIS